MDLHQLKVYLKFIVKVVTNIPWDCKKCTGTKITIRGWTCTNKGVARIKDKVKSKENGMDATGTVKAKRKTPWDCSQLDASQALPVYI
jgi:hypothetical protein